MLDHTSLSHHVFSLGLLHHLKVHYIPVGMHLPARDCVVKDRLHQDDEDFSFVHGKYLQPALQLHHMEPEYEDEGEGEGDDAENNKKTKGGRMRRDRR
jgi:hypothetical protein